MSAHSDLLSKLASEMKRRGALPKSIELSQVGKVHMAAAFNKVDSQLISESVTVGMDSDPDLAVLKALVELIERKAFSAGKLAGQEICATPRSDGFAAFPCFGEGAEEAARENAFCESIERYVWAKWWDEGNISHNVRDLGQVGSEPATELLAAIGKVIPLRQCLEVRPKFASQEYVVIIVVAYLNDMGVVSGGACVRAPNLKEGRFRAMCELVRHALAVRRSMKEGIQPKTFYEKRMVYFGTSIEGERLVQSRLASLGNDVIRLPALKFDAQVSHPLSDLVMVHRCLFENQPPFIGGDLERLCL
jgi:hypothetical protein